MKIILRTLQTRFIFNDLLGMKVCFPRTCVRSGKKIQYRQHYVTFLLLLLDHPEYSLQIYRVLNATVDYILIVENLKQVMSRISLEHFIDIIFLMLLEALGCIKKDGIEGVYHGLRQDLWPIQIDRFPSIFIDLYHAHVLFRERCLLLK